MSKIKISKCPLEGLYIIEPAIENLENGYEMETYNQKDMFEAGLDMRFVQENQSVSKKGVLRGLHFQQKFPQGKLVRVLSGSIYDVAVDVRTGSETYGQWYGVELSAENRKQFYITEGFAHGFYVLSDSAEVCYKVTDYWHPNDDIGIPWNDETLNIKWPIKDGEIPIIAEKDMNYNAFCNLSM